MNPVLAVVSTSWTLVLGGDVMLNGIKPSADVFKGIAPVVKSADLAYANLEIPLTNVGSRTSRKSAEEIAARHQFVLRADPGHAKHFAAAGFDTVSLGNNHALDYGPAGLADFIRRLDKERITWFGAGRNWREARRLQVHEVGGIRVGFLSFLSFNTVEAMRKCTPATGKAAGVATLTITGLPDKKAIPIVKAIVDSAKRECDLLAVALHWGIEKQTQPAPNQVRLGRMFIDQGADLVIGAHPHVLQPSELYKGKPILYSLGNLISPRGGATALYRLRFEGAELRGVDYFPAKIFGGKVALTGKKPSRPKAALSAEKTLLKRYPSKQSKGLLAYF